MRRNADLAQPGADGGAEAGEVVPRREPRRAREEHRRDGDREHPLRKHVEPEGRVDRRRSEIRVDEARGDERVDDRADVDEPERERDGQHQREDAAHRRVAPVEDELEPPVEPPQPGDGEKQLDHRADQDREGVDVEPRGLVVDARNADPEADDDREVPEHRRQRRDGEVVVAC